MSRPVLARNVLPGCCVFFVFSSRRRHTRCLSDWSSDVCSSDLNPPAALAGVRANQDLRVAVMSGSVFAQRHAEGIGRQRVQRVLSRHSANSLGAGQLFTQTFSLTCSHEARTRFTFSSSSP